MPDDSNEKSRRLLGRAFQGILSNEKPRVKAGIAPSREVTLPDAVEGSAKQKPDAEPPRKIVDSSNDKVVNGTVESNGAEKTSAKEQDRNIEAHEAKEEKQANTASKKTEATSKPPAATPPDKRSRALWGNAIGHLKSAKQKLSMETGDRKLEGSGGATDAADVAAPKRLMRRLVVQAGTGRAARSRKLEARVAQVAAVEQGVVRAAVRRSRITVPNLVMRATRSAAESIAHVASEPVASRRPMRASTGPGRRIIVSGSGVTGALLRASTAQPAMRRVAGRATAELPKKAALRSEATQQRLKTQQEPKRKHSVIQVQKSREQARVEQKQAAEDKEMLQLQTRLESHYSLMMNFIRTETEPTIFYLPLKHNKETERQLEDTRQAIRHKIDSLKAHLQPEELEAESDDAGRATMHADGDRGTDASSDEEEEDEEVEAPPQKRRRAELEVAPRARAPGVQQRRQRSLLHQQLRPVQPRSAQVEKSRLSATQAGAQQVRCARLLGLAMASLGTARRKAGVVKEEL